MNRFAITELSSFENIMCIFQLIDEDSIRDGCCFRTKKVAKRTQILSGKIKIKFARETVKKMCCYL